MDILFFTYIRLLYCMYKTFILARRSRSVKFSLNYVYVHTYLKTLPDEAYFEAVKTMTAIMISMTYA